MMPVKITALIKSKGILFAVLAGTVLVYAKLVFYGAISWDDPEMVFKNPDVKNFNLTALFTKHYVGNYIPITMCWHASAWLLFDDWTGGHHLLSLLVHLVNGVLVYRLSNMLFQKTQISLVVVIIFLLHPLQVESVAWISESKTLLSAGFFLVSLIFYHRFLDTHKKTLYAYSLIAFGCAALSKPSVLFLPAILFVFETVLFREHFGKALLRLLPFICITVLVSLLTLKAQNEDLFINHAHEFHYLIRGGFAGYALFNYILLFLFPFNLSVIYPYPTVQQVSIGFGYLVLALIVLALAFAIYKKNQKLLIGIIFFLANIFLMLQFIPFGEALYADRYMYLAIIGLAWFIGFLFEKIRVNPTGVLTGVLLLNAVFCFGRLHVWHDSLFLYEDILKKYPDSFVALNSAGAVCMMQNDHEKSLKYFRHAISVSPGNYKGYYNLGLLYLKNNQADQAIESFNRAINLYDYYKAYNARASAYYMLHDLPKAITDASKAVALNAGNHRGHFVLGNCYNELNQLEEALREYNLALQQENEDSEYYFKRAIVLGKKQNFNESYSDLTVCIGINPKNYEAYYWRGVTLVNLQKNPCEDFKIAAQNNVEAAMAAYQKYCR
jgi:tetratricopeptide (TPR) repeat protein